MGLERKGIYQSKANVISYQSLHLWWFRDMFVYEYVGDVVNTPSFKKRMREYGEEGIQHFYFMMLQKDQVRNQYQFQFLTCAHTITSKINLSSLMPLKMAVSDASQTTVVTQTAMWLNGQ